MKCLKLSPNLRRQTPEVKDAASTEEGSRKVFGLEVKILKNILEMVRKSDNKESSDEEQA